jgi:hypothetical protein
MRTHILSQRKTHDESKLPMGAARGEFVALLLAVLVMASIAYAFWFEATR